ncbi:Aardvark [Ectocarpus siliculosus]|uniref:Aardvark n=1 Tax=Ectocarpus siliculosus TaxID=2880 RepID=D8LKD1_ECTSI|nr:Aardvark [Ectocarpus siliculosus]|eukprot:CBN76076.1 Aardvark [Ectocarpus siliculosus]
MFGRKRGAKASRGASKGNAKAKKAVKRLLEKPGPERMAVLANLAAAENLHPFNGSALGEADACNAVATVMSMFPEHRQVQVEACRAVEALADGTEENVQLLGEANCCHLVEKALERFPNDASIQTQGCRAVTNLFSGEENIRKLGQGRACELVTEALRSFPMDHDVQIEACGAVANLANNSKSNRIKLGRAGACSLVVKSMTTFSDNIDVQHASCVAVGNLANRHEENKRRLGAAGACSKVCAALASFQGDLGVQYMGCGAVGNLANSNAQNCTRLGEAGGCLLVAGAMNAFPSDRNLQHVGCAAVANLAINNDPNASRLVKAGGRVAVERALDIFSDDAEIQTRGEQALEWLSSKNRVGTTLSMKKLTGPESRRQQARVRARTSSSFGGSSFGAGDNTRGNRGRGGRDQERKGSFDSVDDTEDDDDVMTETEDEDDYYDSATSYGGDDDDDDDHDHDDDNEGGGRGRQRTAAQGPLEEGEGSEEEEEHEQEWDDDGMSVVSSVVSTGKAGKKMMMTGATVLGSDGNGEEEEAHSRQSSAELTKVVTPVAVTAPIPSTVPLGIVGLAPVPPPNRPLSRAEQPMGALLEDFDSDGEGNYGPGPGEQAAAAAVLAAAAAAAAVAAENEQASGGGKDAVGPSPPRAQPARSRGGSSRSGHSRSKGSRSNNAAEGSRGGGNSGAARTPAGGDPATSNGSRGRGTAKKNKRRAGSRRGGLDDDGTDYDDDDVQQVAPPTRSAMAQRGSSGHRKEGSRGSQSSRSAGGSRKSSMTDMSLRSAGAVSVPSEFPSKQKFSSRSERSFGSGLSSARRRMSAEEVLMTPAMAMASAVSGLVRKDEAVAYTLQTITGKNPVWFPGMVTNVERLVQRSIEMESVMVAALSELRRFKDSPYDDTLARGEYFDVLYRGLCGAHIAAAVVARGGIVAESKDGWLRKASALVRIVCLACPSIKPGVELLGKALQLAERDKMADHVEHVAKSSRSPRHVSSLAEQTALRLVFEEGRAEADEKSLEAMRRLEHPTDEWLPVWLLEEAAVEGDQGDGGVVVAGLRARGAPGTETARRAAVVDGCTMIKEIGKRSVYKIVMQENKEGRFGAEVGKKAARAGRGMQLRGDAPRPAAASSGGRGPASCE